MTEINTISKTKIDSKTETETMGRVVVVKIKLEVCCGWHPESSPSTNLF